MKQVKHIFILTAFLFICSFAFAQKAKIRKAESLIESGKYRDAEKIYLEVLKTDPDNYNANYDLGELYVEFLNDLQHGQPCILKAMTLSKKDTIEELFFYYAKCLHFYGKYEKAQSYYKHCQKLISGHGKTAQKLMGEIVRCIESCQYGIE
ncbi:MAG: tetratricopeptide repeat protein, partial [Bacteroidia bacterium]|nr:tetratricopeptide repeat protein [Bacteroidia bacterium]